MHDTMRNKRGNKGNPYILFFLLLSLCYLVALTDSVCGQQAESEAVGRLRRALQATYPSRMERDRIIKQCLAELHSLADWQGAVSLVEWRASSADEGTAAIDHANEEATIEGFRAAVRGILRQGDPASMADTMEMLSRMATLARAANEPLTLVSGVAPQLADVVIGGPPRLRGLAARTLAQIEPSVFIAVPALSELLRAEDASLRCAAADSFALLLQNALQAGGGSGLVLRPGQRNELVLAACTVLPAVHMGLDDTRPEVRRRCLETIGLACAVLSRLMDQPSAHRPLQAEYEELRPLLMALRDQSPILGRFLHDNDPETRILTHKALEELGVARGRWLHRCAANREGADEKLLAELLHEALPGLAEALAHPDVRVRLSALDVLETSGSLALPALPALTRALHDKNRFVVRSAVRTVGKLGPPAASQTIAELTPLLRDPDPDLRKAAVNALEQLLRGESKPRP